MTRTVMTSSPGYGVLSSVADCWLSFFFWVAWGQGTSFRRKIISPSDKW